MFVEVVPSLSFFQSQDIQSFIDPARMAPFIEELKGRVKTPRFSIRKPIVRRRILPLQCTNGKRFLADFPVAEPYRAEEEELSALRVRPWPRWTDPKKAIYPSSYREDRLFCPHPTASRLWKNVLSAL
jgi:hypothetical protein